ncbi:cell division protein FtsQ/DivIB [Leeuwenhoekiella sp. A16]|uniref:cell division protein FtsQ/DivIB n=1 Tax=unclassified Leeuwenhoekiella TaxID=2615029 RepID=UPI003A80A55B
MKVNWFYIKMLVIVCVAGFLFAFANKRNAVRKIENIKVNFEGDQNLFITEDAVNKLLIQSDVALTGKGKEILVLKELEDKLDANAMIYDADVYITVDGVIGANVKQRKPLARIQSAQPFYIDDKGETMPLSTNYSARVPIAEGVTKENLSEIYPLLMFIKNDEFLNKQIVGISRVKNGSYTLTPRVLNYKINLGKIENLQSKFNNYKAFHQKALKDKSLEAYSMIDLRFKGQVVGTKK